ncbi:centrosomal protein of 76 kDa-like isoform X2 [Dysidea avara]|uniref:centrosomal protein of 76 kDa-like isoform X2 n=1 Tax=Dysidea avara TaxID=196820 RepID=UPI0033346298
MSEEAIKSIGHTHGPPTVAAVTWCSIPPLCTGTIDPVLCSNEVEIELRSVTSQYRMDSNLSTHWDDEMCYLLTSALAAYELDRCVGMTSAGNEEFQQAIWWTVPHGHTFKGFPIQFIHRNVHKMFATCLN